MPKNHVENHVENCAITRVAVRPRFRNTVTTVMLVLMTVMIVGDILLRRWGSPPPSPDVTRRLP
jgi:hypothetical protein